MPGHSQHCSISGKSFPLAVDHSGMTSQSSGIWFFGHDLSTVQHFLCWQIPAFDTQFPDLKNSNLLIVSTGNRNMDSFTCLSHSDSSEPKWCQCAGMISMHRMLIKGARWSPIFSLGHTPVCRHHWGHNCWKRTTFLSLPQQFIY